MNVAHGVSRVGQRAHLVLHRGFNRGELHRGRGGVGLDYAPDDRRYRAEVPAEHYAKPRSGLLRAR